MIRKALMLCLPLLLLLMAPSYAETPAAYTLLENGVIFEVFFLPGGDILQYGSFGREMEDGQTADTSMLRTKPDGTVVWVLDLPMSQDGLGFADALIPLSDGRYLLPHMMGEGMLQGFFADAGKGMDGQISLPYGQQRYFSVEDGVLEASPSPDAGHLLLRRLDLQGQAVWQHEYALPRAEEADLNLLETEDSLYLLVGYHSGIKDAPGRLMKLTKEGLLQWQQTDDSRHGFGYMLHPDGAGGVLLLGDNGMYDNVTAYPYVARRIDAQGNTVWRKEVEVGAWVVRWDTATEEGIRMIWETEDTFRFATLDRDGNLAMEPIHEKPDTNGDGAYCWVAGYAVDEAGRQWVYCNAIKEIDSYNTDVKPFIQLLDAFPVVEEER